MVKRIKNILILIIYPNIPIRFSNLSSNPLKILNFPKGGKTGGLKPVFPQSRAVGITKGVIKEQGSSSESIPVSGVQRSLFQPLFLFLLAIDNQNQSRKVYSWEDSLSQGNTCAVVLQLARQDATIDLVKFHQLDQVCKASLSVIHGIVKPSFFLTRKYKVVLHLLQVTE